MRNRARDPFARRCAGIQLTLAAFVAFAFAAGAEPGSAQGVSGSVFDQPGKLKFKTKERIAFSDACDSSSKVKFSSLALIEFGPGDDLAENAFRMAILFSDRDLVRVEGTYAEKDNGKIELEPDDALIINDLDDLVLGGLKSCKVKAKFKLVEEGNPRVAKTRVKTKCKLTGVSPKQHLKFRAKGKGPEITSQR
jgi:hypothetical protein